VLTTWLLVLVEHGFASTFGTGNKYRVMDIDHQRGWIETDSRGQLRLLCRRFVCRDRGDRIMFLLYLLRPTVKGPGPSTSTVYGCRICRNIPACTRKVLHMITLAFKVVAARS
jgi:hypothetical protein